jgi:hypothetical protein
MQVICPHCGEKSFIKRRNDLNDKKTVSDLYVICTNVPDCGASMVFSLAYKHDINTPAKTTLEIAKSLIKRTSQNLTAREKKQLQNDMFETT